MPNEHFYMSLEAYKRGRYDLIGFYDVYQNYYFRLHPKQIKACEVYNDDHTTSIGYGGAARGGKSALMCLLVLMDSFAYPQTRYLMGRRDLRQFWGTTYKTLLRMLDNFGFVDQEDYNHNQQKNEIQFFKPQSEIVIKNLELQPRDPDATAFGSLEITRACIDQSENISLKIIEKITERAGSYGVINHGIKGKVLECFNPLKTHVHRRFWLLHKNGIQNPSVAFIQSLPTDNPGPEARSWVKQKEQDYRDGIMPKVEYEKQIKGNFDYADSDTSLINYDDILNYWNNQTIETSGEMYLTIDVARKGKDKTVYRVWNGFLCVARFAQDKSTIPEVIDKARAIQEKYKITNSNTIADEDGVGGGVVDGIGCQGFVNNSRPINGENYANLKAQCAYMLAKKFKAKEIGEICHSSEIRNMTTEELEQLKVKDIHKDGKLDIVPKHEIVANLGRSPDDLDSIIMRMYFDLHEPIWFA